MLKGSIGHTGLTGLAARISALQEIGYVENLVPRYDHLSFNSDAVKLYPKDFTIDRIIRFDEATDPADQSILYAISSKDDSIKGIYVESYGVYHDNLSPEMLERIKTCELALRDTSPPSEDNGPFLNR